MTATLLEILTIISLGLLAGTGAGLLIGYLAGLQEREWALMQVKNKRTAFLLVLACSTTAVALLSWYLFQYSAA
jgi:hypothetical protein